MAASAAGRTEFFLAVWLEPQRLSQKFKGPDSPWVGSQRFSEETGRGQQQPMLFLLQHKLLWVTPLPKALASLAPSDPQIFPISPNRRNLTSSCNFSQRKLAFLKRSKAFYSWWKWRYIIPSKKSFICRGSRTCPSLWAGFPAPVLLGPHWDQQFCLKSLGFACGTLWRMTCPELFWSKCLFIFLFKHSPAWFEWSTLK